MIYRLLPLFLLLWLVVSLVGRWRRRVSRNAPKPRIEAASRCPDCGAFVVGASPSPCARGDCHFRSA